MWGNLERFSLWLKLDLSPRLSICLLRLFIFILVYFSWFWFSQEVWCSSSAYDPKSCHSMVGVWLCSSMIISMIFSWSFLWSLSVLSLKFCLLFYHVSLWLLYKFLDVHTGSLSLHVNVLMPVTFMACILFESLIEFSILSCHS